MGVISDAIDSLETWCSNLFKDGVKSQFDGISNLLSDTFANTTGSDGKQSLIQIFIANHPAQFTGSLSGSGGTSVWTTIETLCNNVVVPIGGFILTVILLNDLIQMVIRGNNFKDFDDSIFIKWIIKCLCGVILVSNTYYIASALFTFGTNVCSNGLTTLFGGGKYLPTALELKKTALDDLELSELMTVWFISLIVHLGVMVLIVAIVITLASRIIENFHVSFDCTDSNGNYDGQRRMVRHRKELDKTAFGSFFSGVLHHRGSWHFQNAVSEYDCQTQRWR